MPTRLWPRPQGLGNASTALATPPRPWLHPLGLRVRVRVCVRFSLHGLCHAPKAVATPIRFLYRPYRHGLFATALATPPKCWPRPMAMATPQDLGNPSMALAKTPTTLAMSLGLRVRVRVYHHGLGHAPMALTTPPRPCPRPTALATAPRPWQRLHGLGHVPTALATPPRP